MTTISAESSVETWRPVPGFEGHYQVSDYGRIQSFKWGKRRTVRLTPDGGGYLKFHARLGDIDRTLRVHVLVSLAFHGSRPDGQHIKPNGGRRCRACWREHCRNYRAKPKNNPNPTGDTPA